MAGVTWKYYNKRISKDRLESDLEDARQRLDYIKDELKYYCFSSPECRIDEGGTIIEPESYLVFNVRDLLDQFEEAASEVFVLEGIKDDLSYEEDGVKYVEWEED